MGVKLIYLAFIILVVRFVFKTLNKTNSVGQSSKHDDDIIDAEYTVLDDEKRS